MRLPQPEGAVDMEPGVAPLPHHIGDLVDGVEGARVHIARLRADDGRPVARGQQLAQRLGEHPALRIGRRALQPAAAQTEQLRSDGDRDVRFLTSYDVELRSTLKAVRGRHPSPHASARPDVQLPAPCEVTTERGTQLRQRSARSDRALGRSSRNPIAKSLVRLSNRAVSPPHRSSTMSSSMRRSEYGDCLAEAVSLGCRPTRCRR